MSPWRLRAEPRIKDRIERFVLMNGVFFRAGLEYNTYRDPEASEIVYNSGLPVVAVGLDVTMKCMLTLEQLDQMEKSPYENVRFLRKLISSWQNGNAQQRPILHDPFAVLVSFQPGTGRDRGGRGRGGDERTAGRQLRPHLFQTVGRRRGSRLPRRQGGQCSGFVRLASDRGAEEALESSQ